MSSKSKSRSKRNSTKTPSKATDNGKPIKSQNEGRNQNVFDLGEAMENTIRKDDIEKIVSIQIKSLGNLSKTNELLGKFNDFSSSKYDVLQHMFVQHTRLLVELKKDLSNVFLRIRRLKTKLQRQYPDAFEATFNLRKALEDKLEQEVPNKPTYDAKIKDDVEQGRNRTKPRNKVASNNLVGEEENDKKNTTRGSPSGHSDLKKCDSKVMDNEASIVIESTEDPESSEQSIENTETTGNMGDTDTSLSVQLGYVNLVDVDESHNEVAVKGECLGVSEAEGKERKDDLVKTGGDLLETMGKFEIVNDETVRIGDNLEMEGSLIEPQHQLEKNEGNPRSDPEAQETGDNLEKIEKDISEEAEHNVLESNESFEVIDLENHELNKKMKEKVLRNSDQPDRTMDVTDEMKN